ncbi:hypothetical protein ACXYTJ_15185 [Gilvimarinus sp. F26214L]|uniref:hypothetical protein n=1 Tax=Gilvimarinus sp. DZF01 TaxID=3461371 RepID=UPI0040464316
MKHIMVPAVLLLLAACAGEHPGVGSVETASGEPLPVCKRRSASSPGRLNVDASALRHGVAPPCEVVVEFYIARNTPLRALAGNVQYRDPDGGTILDFPFRANLEYGGNGMLQQRVAGRPGQGLACGELDLGIELSGCFDERGDEVQCPPVRIKKNVVFQRILVAADGVDVCAD